MTKVRRKRRSTAKEDEQVDPICCDTCLFVLAGQGYDECHRRPPQVVGDSDDVSSDWPPVEADDFCGEWVRADKPYEDVRAYLRKHGDAAELGGSDGDEENESQSG